jgi:hypothetical protein
MAAGPLRLLSFYREIEVASHKGLMALDREDLLALHKALVNLKFEVEQLLTRCPADEQRSEL